MVRLPRCIVTVELNFKLTAVCFVTPLLRLLNTYYLADLGVGCLNIERSFVTG